MRGFAQVIGIVAASWAFVASAIAQPVGYYRAPAIGGDTIVFVSEGDLWKVGVKGGEAIRLTTHLGEESQPLISPDGKSVAFAAQYEGPSEVYTMPVEGGLPTRRTFDGATCLPISWVSNDVLMYSTRRYSTLPSTQLAKLTLSTGVRSLVPLAQASDGIYAGEGGPLVFTRIPFQGSATKRYVGGRVQSLWRFDEAKSGPSPEAVHLTADYPGTSTSPMWWSGRIYFASDRDGTMNVWSMTPDGKDVKQHTSHNGLDIKGPTLSNGRIAYQCGADVWLYDIARGDSAKLDITLGGDFDQNRERWVKKPIDYLTAAHISPSGDKVVLTARGQIFVAPRKQGRFVTLTNDPSARRRDARFMPDGNTILALSDQSDEVEFWTLPADGSGTASQLTSDSAVLRWEGIPSPDGKWLAHHNKDQQLFITEIATKATKKIDESNMENIEGLAWSPDSKFLAYVRYADNSFKQIRIHDLAAGQSHDFTTDRQDSYSPAWSPDGKFLYFISDRNLRSVVGSPWGPMQPEPYFENKSKVYITALIAGNRSPFEPDNELVAEKEKAEKDKKDADKKDTPADAAKADDKKDEAKKDDAKKDDGKKDDAKKEDKKDAKKAPPEVKIDFTNFAARTQEVPIPPGDYSSLVVTEKRLLLFATVDDKRALQFAPIDKTDVTLKTIASDISFFDVSDDLKAILLRKGDTLYVIDSTASGPSDLDKAAVDLGGWSFPLKPRDEWMQMYRDAWRLHRDYFYDRGMHKIDWKGMREKYAPLAARVNSRGELSDVLAQMVGELSALHHFVRGGEFRTGPDQVFPAFLGADLAVEPAGWRVKKIYQADPDLIERVSPLAKPDVNVLAGELIIRINNTPLAGVNEPQALLRNLVGKQVLLHVQNAAGDERRVIVNPISADSDADLRYHDWEYLRRLYVEKRSNGRLGYVHLRAMGNENYTEFARNYYPDHTREALVVDVRNNRGGNIDSWILSRLMRKAWFYWQPRVGKPTWNMQFAFRGPMVTLCNEATASDGEAFAEGFRRLGLGKVIGTRTWGGEIWLSSSNVLVDKGIASAAEIGVFGPEGEWLIEGWGVEPDIVVDNPPSATFNGEDKQLDVAIDLLLKQLDEKPVKQPVAPEHPDLRHAPGTMVKDRAPKK